MTFAVLYEPRAHSRSKGFIDRIPAALEEAERSEGFIARSHLDPDTGRHSWGELICPRFFSDDLHPNVARTLSLWRSLESVFAFSYGGLHREAMTLPNPDAFNFRRSFDSGGNSTVLDRVLAKEIVARNAKAR